MTGTWAFGYDTLNRLTAANASSGPYSGESGCWNYDAFGNRTVEAFSTQTTTPCAQGANDNAQYTVTTPTALNQVSGFQYDAAGNVLNDGKNNYWYDAEGRLCAVAYPNGSGGAYYEQYLYDAEGRRVGKVPASSLSCAAPTGAPTNQYLLGLGGEQVTEVNGLGAPLHTNAYAGGKLLATYDFINGGLHFVLTDPLGTKRVQISATGTAELNCQSLPFGNDLGNPRVTDCVVPTNGVGAPDATEHHFTGKERDTESGNDYFGARYYASSMGRWISPDQLNLTDARILNPANTLNKYAYGANNPLKYIDQDGKDITVFYAGPSLLPPGAGHFMMVAENQQSGDAAVMSFGPVRSGFGEAEQTLAGFPMMSTNTFDSNMSVDELRQNYSSLTIQTSPEEAQQVIDFIRNHPDGFQNTYTLYNQNCSTVCREALKVIGKIAGNNTKDWTPTQMWKNMFKNYANSWWKNNAGLWFNQPGANYGSPRGNYDEFDLLGLLLKGDNSSVRTTSCDTLPDGTKNCY